MTGLCYADQWRLAKLRNSAGFIHPMLLRPDFNAIARVQVLSVSLNGHLGSNKSQWPCAANLVLLNVSRSSYCRKIGMPIESRGSGGISPALPSKNKLICPCCGFRSAALNLMSVNVDCHLN